MKGLQGCPKGETPRRLWFSTHTDPIADRKNDIRTSIIHAYKDGDDIVEVLKVRIQKSGVPEYWETSRPYKKYNLQGKEVREPISKHVVYLNFRSMLSAFDKCFFYSGRENVQDYIRNQSRKLKNAILSKSIYKFGSKKQNEPAITLSQEKLKFISYVLCRSYNSAVYQHHKFFDRWGDSIFFTSTHHKYSEAFAGSGETAVAILINSIEDAPTGSLIVIDEPEISLHPEAQKRLKNYFLDTIKRKKHQIVISTHSPFLTEGLPKEAIKALKLSSESGETEIIENINSFEAFSLIGGETPGISRNIINVEDKLSKAIIDGVLECIGAPVNSTFEVRILGSQTAMYKDVSSLCDKPERSRYFYIFDGDTKPNTTSKLYAEQNERNLFVYSSINIKNNKLENLEKLIKYQTNTDTEKLGIKTAPPTPEHHMQRAQNFLQFMERNCFFLPNSSIPEELIWSNDSSKSKLTDAYAGNAHNMQKALDEIDNMTDYKDKFETLCKHLYPGNINSQMIFDEQKKFLKRFLSAQDSNFKKIRETILTIRDLANEIQSF